MCSPTAGGADAMRRALAVERERERWQAQVRDRRVLERLEDAECLRLLGVGDVGDVGDGRGRNAGCGEPVAPVGRVALSEARRHECDELLAVPHAIGVRPEALVRRRARAARAPRRAGRRDDRFRRRPSARRRGWGRPGTARPSGTSFPVRSEPCRPRGSRRGGSRCSRGPSRRGTCRPRCRGRSAHVRAARRRSRAPTTCRSPCR